MTKQIDKIHNYVSKMMQGEQTGHGFDHIQRVVNNAKRILQNETANADVVLTAAYLHDVFDDKLTDEVAGRKADVYQKLVECEYDETEINEIFYIISHMSFSDNLEHHYDLSIEGQIVQDADRLDALGAIGIARLFAFGGVHRYPMYNPKENQVSHTKAEYRRPRATINHYEERLQEVIKRINTDTAKEFAQHRFTVAEGFIKQFKTEWENN